MAEFVERRKGGDRRKGPVRSGEDRRTVKAGVPADSPARQGERRKRERRSGLERRKAGSRPPAK